MQGFVFEIPVWLWLDQAPRHQESLIGTGQLFIADFASISKWTCWSRHLLLGFKIFLHHSFVHELLMQKIHFEEQIVNIWNWFWHCSAEPIQPTGLARFCVLQFTANSKKTINTRAWLLLWCVRISQMWMISFVSKQIFEECNNLSQRPMHACTPRNWREGFF